MHKYEKKSILALNIIVVQMLFLFFTGPSFSVNIGDPFPLFRTANTLEPEECFYLGIECGDDFALNDLYHEVIVIEFLNVYCHTCRTQVEIFNDLFLTIEKDPDLNEKVRIIGMAVGNSVEEIKEFKDNFGALYPILSDLKKTIFNMTANIQGTPHTYIIRKEEKRFVIDYHAGGVSSKDRYLSTIKFALRGNLSGTEPGNKAAGYAFKSGGVLFDEKKFTGKRVILYFPVDKTYTLEIDTRYTQNQIQILHKILKKYPDLNVILFKYPGLSADFRKIGQQDSFYAAELVNKENVGRFGSDDKPTIYYINEYGRIAFKGDAITLYNAESILEGKEYLPAPAMGEDEIINLIEAHIEKLGKKVIETEKFVMQNQNKIFVTAITPKRDGLFRFSRLASELSLCDICHDSHFVYVVDQEGIIKEFIPIQLTKQGNVPWDEEDRLRIKKSVVGKSIFDDFTFNPKADAISTATMTSSLVFESLNRGKDIFGDFKDYKFRRGYWRQTCFQNICTIKMQTEKIKNEDKKFVLNDTTLNAMLSGGKFSGCPQQGFYIVLDGDMLCSVHGINTHGCGQSIH